MEISELNLLNTLFNYDVDLKLKYIYY